MSAVVRMRTLISALVMTACAGSWSVLRTQQPVPTATSHTISQRSPEVATILGVLIPGAGQLYAERYGKAAGVLGGTALALGIAIDANNNQCSTAPCNRHKSVQTAGIAAAVLLWGYGWVTAAHDARLHNAQRLNTVLAPFLDRKNGRVLAGFSVATR